PRRLAARAAAGARTWRKPAAPTAPRPRPRSRPSKARSPVRSAVAVGWVERACAKPISVSQRLSRAEMMGFADATHPLAPDHRSSEWGWPGPTSDIGHPRQRLTGYKIVRLPPD